MPRFVYFFPERNAQFPSRFSWECFCFEARVGLTAVFLQYAHRRGWFLSFPCYFDAPEWHVSHVLFTTHFFSKRHMSLLTVTSLYKNKTAILNSCKTPSRSAILPKCFPRFKTSFTSKTISTNDLSCAVFLILKKALDVDSVKRILCVLFPWNHSQRFRAHSFEI